MTAAAKAALADVFLQVRDMDASLAERLAAYSGAVKKQYAIGPLDPTVLFVGRMVVQKGPDILVRTMPAVLKFYPATKFVFVGDGHMRNEVAGLAHHLGCAHALRLLGAKQGREAGIRVEAGPTQPVDRAVARDQRGALAITDQRIIFDTARHLLLLEIDDDFDVALLSRECLGKLGERHAA